MKVGSYQPFSTAVFFFSMPFACFSSEPATSAKRLTGKPDILSLFTCPVKLSPIQCTHDFLSADPRHETAIPLFTIFEWADLSVDADSPLSCVGCLNNCVRLWKTVMSTSGSAEGARKIGTGLVQSMSGRKRNRDRQVANQIRVCHCFFSYSANKSTTIRLPISLYKHSVPISWKLAISVGNSRYDRAA